MNSLTPLKVPRQLLRKKSRSTDSSQAQSQDEGGASAENQTDQEKTVVKKTASLIEVSGPGGERQMSRGREWNRREEG